MVYCGRPSRGCEPCRTRRVKCDQKLPSCGQCQRTGRDCPGYRSDHDVLFRDESQRVTIKCKKIADAKDKKRREEDNNTNNVTQISCRKKSNKSPHRKSPPGSVSGFDGRPSLSEYFLDFLPNAVSSSKSGLLVRNFVAQLELGNDLRYSITWLWGSHMLDVPRRIGFNPALDAAVAALLAVHHDVRTMSAQTNETQLLGMYNDAMRCIRFTLQDPDAGNNPEIMCAVAMLSACTPRFEGPGGAITNAHARGAAELLRMRDFCSTGQTGFETLLFTMLRDALAVKSLYDEGITFTPEEWDKFENTYQGDWPTARLLRCVVRIGRMCSYARKAASGSYEEEGIRLWAKQLQSQLDLITWDLEYLVYRPKDDEDVDPAIAAKLHAQDQRNFNQSLITTAQLLCIRRAFALPEESFHDELNLLCSRILQLADECKIYRPLGANWIILALMTVWCAAFDTPLQIGIEKVLDGWRADTLGEGSKMPREALYDLYERLRFGRGSPVSTPLSFSEPPSTPRSDISGCGHLRTARNPLPISSFYSLSTQMSKLLLVPGKTALF